MLVQGQPPRFALAALPDAGMRFGRRAMTITVNATKTRKSIKRVYRNSDGVPLTIEVMPDTLRVYAPGCVLSHADFASVLPRCKPTGMH